MTTKPKGQAIRPPTAGPEHVTCVVREKATGRVVLQAEGCIRNEGALGGVTQEEWRRFKKELRRKFDLTEYEFLWTYR